MTDETDLSPAFSAGCCPFCGKFHINYKNENEVTQESSRSVPEPFGSAPDPYTPTNNPTNNPYLDSLIWGGSWDLNTDYGGASGTITYSFSTYADQNGNDVTWYDYEKTAVRNALQTIETVIDVDFVEKSFFDPDPYYENIVFDWVFNVDWLGMHQVPKDVSIEGETYTDYTLVGTYNFEENFWNSQTLMPGGMAYATIIHEVLHGLALAHPHDNGGGSSIFPGVTGAFESYGDFNLNQQIFTIMSYNDGFPANFPDYNTTLNGQAASPMALDIAALQFLYGPNLSTNTGNDYFNLPTANSTGTGWKSLWDAGGIDTISAVGASSGALIQLEDAKLVAPYAGGVVSHIGGILGGFTIANGVVIENAIGSNFDDYIVGNNYDNSLRGEGGDDIIFGGGGVNSLWGGSGSDTFYTGLDKLFGHSQSITTVKDFEIGVDYAGAVNVTENLEIEYLKLSYDFTQDGFRRGTTPDGSTLTLDNIYQGTKSGFITIDGAPNIGETLSVSYSLFSDTDLIVTPTISFDWYRDGTIVSSGKSNQYTVQEEDAGSEISVSMSYLNYWGEEQTTVSDNGLTIEDSNSSASFFNGTLTGGEHYPGKEITANLEFSDPDGTSNSVLTYSWYRYDGTTFDLITSGLNTYTIQEADIGYTIAFTATFTDDAGNQETSIFYLYLETFVDSYATPYSQTDLDTSKATATAAGTAIALTDANGTVHASVDVAITSNDAEVAASVDITSNNDAVVASAVAEFSTQVTAKKAQEAALSAEVGNLTSEINSVQQEIDNLKAILNQEDQTPYAQADLDAAFSSGASNVDITTDNAQAIETSTSQLNLELSSLRASLFDIQSDLSEKTAETASLEAVLDAKTAHLNSLGTDTVYSQSDLDTAIANAVASVDITLDNAAAISAAFTSNDGTVYQSVQAAIQAGFSKGTEDANTNNNLNASFANLSYNSGSGSFLSLFQQNSIDITGSGSAFTSIPKDFFDLETTVKLEKSLPIAYSYQIDTPYTQADLDAAYAAAYAAAIQAALTSANGTVFSSIDAAIISNDQEIINTVDITADDYVAITIATQHLMDEVLALDASNAALTAQIESYNASLDVLNGELSDVAYLVENKYDDTPFSQADIDQALNAGIASVDITTDNGAVVAQAMVQLVAEIVSKEAEIAAVQAQLDGVDQTIFALEATIADIEAQLSNWQDTTPYSDADLNAAVAAAVSSIDITSDNAQAISQALTFEGRTYQSIDEAFSEGYDEGYDRTGGENQPGFGSIKLTGIFEVGSEITADFSGITDPDGIVRFTKIEWIFDGNILSDDPRGVTTNPNNNNFLIQTTEIGGKISVRITYEDGLGKLETITSGEIDIHEFIDLSIPKDMNVWDNIVLENATAGTTVGITVLSEDGNGGVITYSLSDDANGRFTINPNNGVVTVADGSLIDYENATSHQITVVAQNETGSSSSNTFTIGVENIAPKHYSETVFSLGNLPLKDNIAVFTLTVDSQPDKLFNWDYSGSQEANIDLVSRASENISSFIRDWRDVKSYTIKDSLFVDNNFSGPTTSFATLFELGLEAVPLPKISLSVDITHSINDIHIAAEVPSVSNEFSTLDEYNRFHRSDILSEFSADKIEIFDLSLLDLTEAGLIKVLVDETLLTSYEHAAESEVSFGPENSKYMNYISSINTWISGYIDSWTNFRSDVGGDKTQFGVGYNFEDVLQRFDLPYLSIFAQDGTEIEAKILHETISNSKEYSSIDDIVQSQPVSYTPGADEFQINTHTASYKGTPSVTGLADGGFVVTWFSYGQDGDGNGIYGQRYDGNGVAAVDAEFQINTHTANNQGSPSVTSLADGGFVVTWF
ncbi:M10 family metallopeptidase C-terminal domain-containing protein, partial [Paracoccaceae bacterium]|nr:M10 family metallopeptidase C-terminal domain-containing protein [Paracoccaceae bacterium]